MQCERHIFGQIEVRDEPFRGSVLRHEAQCVRQLHGALVRGQATGEDEGKLPLAVPFDAGDAHDLAGAQREIDPAEARRPPLAHGDAPQACHDGPNLTVVTGDL